MGRALPGAILNSNDWFRFCLLLPSGSAYLPRSDHGLFWESERDGVKRELVTSLTLFSKKKLSRPEESHNITSMDLCTLILDPSSGFFDGANRLTVCNVIREKRVSSLQEYAAQKKLRAVFSLQNCKGKGNRKGVSLNLQYLFFSLRPISSSIPKMEKDDFLLVLFLPTGRPFADKKVRPTRSGNRISTVSIS